jgi:hypothetical protein
MPTALDFFLQNAEASAGVQHTQAETQQALANTNLLNTQVQQMAGNRQAIQEAVLAQQNAGAAQAGTTPTTNAQGIPLDPTTGQPKVTGINANPDMMNLNSTISGLQQRQQMYQSVMNNPKSSPQMVQQYSDMYTKAQQDIAAAQEKQLGLKKDLITQIGGIASAAGRDPAVAAGDPDAFATYHQQLDAIAPGYLNDKDVDHDLVGNVTAGPRTAKVLASMGQASMSAQQQLATAAETAQGQGRLIGAQAAAASEALREKEFDAKEAQAQAKAAAQSGPPAVKVVTPKTPTTSEVNNHATSLASELVLPPAQAKAAAQDMLEMRNALIAKGTDPVLADQQAHAAIVAKAQPGTPAATTPGMLYGTNTTPAVPGVYPKPAEATTAPAAAAPAAGGPPTALTKEAAMALPSGTVFIGPDGKQHVRK